MSGEGLRVRLRNRLKYAAAGGPQAEWLIKFRPAYKEFYAGKRVTRVGSIGAFLPHTDKFSVVSFDIFDTLIERNIEPPDYIKHRSARFLAMLMRKDGLEATQAEIMAARDEEESRLRRNALEDGFDHECGLDEIMQAAGARLGASEEVVAKWREYEIAAEIDHLKPKPGAKELLQALKARGKRVFLISDMYLHKRDLEAILGHHGLLEYVEEVFVSSEHRLGKHSRKLFSTVLGILGIAPSELIHVGDNYMSDVIRPMQLGISAVWLYEPKRLRERHALAAEMHESNSMADWSAIAAKVGATPSLPARVNSFSSVAERALYQVGFEILGPLYALYAAHSLEQAVELGVDDIYFLAREGELFKIACEKLLANVKRFRLSGHAPRLHYLYVSRVATILPSIRELGERELKIARFRYYDVNLRELLRTFGLKTDDFADEIEQMKVDTEKVAYSPDEERELLKAVSHPAFNKKLKGLIEDSRSRLRKYLEQEGFFGAGGKKMFCDIGWNGTIQVNVTRAFGRDQDFPKLYGMYFGRHSTPLYEYDEPNSVFLPGYAIDPDRYSEEEASISKLLAIFEIAAAAPHPSTVGYGEMDGKFGPIFAKETATDLTSPPRQALRDGVRDYIDAFAVSYGGFEVDLSALRTSAIRNVARFLNNPTAAEAKGVACLRHEIDWGDEGTLMLVSDKTTWSSVFKPAAFRREVHRSIWKEGTLATLGAALPVYQTGAKVVRSGAAQFPMRVLRKVKRELRKLLG